MSLITSNSKGLYCEAGDFYVDPWGKVKTALITHAHADHLRKGSKHYYCTYRSRDLVDLRLPDGDSYQIHDFPFDQTFTLNGVDVSFHPAGHILGSAQVRLEHKDEVTVLTGDYKHETDPSCKPFEQLEADTLVTEATFGLPIYRWQSPEKIMDEIYSWWMDNRANEMVSCLFGYSLGKTQRILAELSKYTDETVFIHGALHETNEVYRALGVELLNTELVVDQDDSFDYRGKLVISPPGSLKTRWMSRFKDHSSAFASGWMRVRGKRRFGGYDTGFELSDHADWPSLLSTVNNSGASTVYVGFTKSPVFVRYLRDELGYDAKQLQVRYSGEDD